MHMLCTCYAHCRPLAHRSRRTYIHPSTPTPPHPFLHTHSSIPTPPHPPLHTHPSTPWASGRPGAHATSQPHAHSTVVPTPRLSPCLLSALRPPDSPCLHASAALRAPSWLRRSSPWSTGSPTRVRRVAQPPSRQPWRTRRRAQAPGWALDDESLDEFPVVRLYGCNWYGMVYMG